MGFATAADVSSLLRPVLLNVWFKRGKHVSVLIRRITAVNCQLWHGDVPGHDAAAIRGSMFVVGHTGRYGSKRGDWAVWHVCWSKGKTRVKHPAERPVDQHPCRGETKLQHISAKP